MNDKNLKFKSIYRKSKSAGYTILETMIAVSVFIIVITMGLSALLNANSLHRSSQNMRSIIDNLSFIMDDMSRNIRTGYTYKCFRKGTDLTLSSSAISSSPTTRSCSDGWALAFESTAGLTTNNSDQWVYYIDNNGKIWRSTESSANAIQLTSNEINIDTTKSGFSVLGAEPFGSGNSQQPIVIIRLVGTITYKNINTPFSVQTTISQRLMDL